jgi:cold shock CspA family protein
MWTKKATSVPPRLTPKKKKVFNAEDIEIGVSRSKEADDPIKEGKIDFFDGSRGFGFIIQNDGDKIFFHINQTTYPVKEGDVVNYSIERGPKGWNAVGVTKKS